jgi:HD-like signal output (HDOD) protein
MISLHLDDLIRKTESLPKLPGTTVRLIRVINDPATTFQQIVDVIRFDQTVTAELLRLCNSAYFGLTRQITSIDDAIRFVGTGKLMQLVMAAHTQALLGPEQTGYGLLPGALWRHSVGVALACQLVAERVGMKEKGLMFTVGLLHDIGKIVLNENVGAEYACIVRTVHEEQIPFQEAEERVLGITHPVVGELVAKRWKLPAPIPCCIRYHHEPSALPTPDPVIDALHLADAACLLLGIGGGDDGQLYHIDEAVLGRMGISALELEKIGATVVHELKSIQKLFGME